MDKITEELTWLLGDFKNGLKDYNETVLGIQRIYARTLGFCIIQDIHNEELKKK